MQRALAEVLRGESPVASVIESTALADGIADGNERLTPAMQLEIYREQFFLRHLDVLREDFRSLAYLLGDEAFESLAKAYSSAFPPRSFTLRDLGADLVRFVATMPSWAEDALLADLARVEWAFVACFDASSAPALDLLDLVGVCDDAWPFARVVLQPTVQRLSLRHAAHGYRLAIRNGEADLDRPAAKPSKVIVFRGPAALQCLDLEPDAYALLAELARGTPLGDACERVAAFFGVSEAASQEKVGSWFQQWTTLGLISRVELAG